MPKHVLDVGQCDQDHVAIATFLRRHFDVEVVPTNVLDDTLAALRSGKFDLVLVNRKLDVDYSNGLEIVKRIKADPALAATPLMLITNYPEHQATAISAGAVSGFGKRELDRPETVENLKKFLG